MSPRVSEILYWLASLLIAVALWYVSAVEKREPESEKGVEASVSYNNKPEALVILNRVPEVTVRLKGRNQDIRRLRPREVDVEVDLSELGPTDAGSFTFNLEPENVFLPYESLEVLSIEPNFISLRLDTKAQARVPIEIDLTGEPAAGAAVDDREVTPNTALVEGPASQVDRLTRIRTSPVSLDGHAVTFQEQVPLVVPDPLMRIIQPQVVTVRINMRLPQPVEGGVR